MTQLLRLAGARMVPGPQQRQLPDDWVPVWTDLSRVRLALDEALAFLQLLNDQVDGEDLVLRDLRWQTAEAARSARAYYQQQVDRLAGATAERSQHTSQHADHGPPGADTEEETGTP